MDQLNLTKQLTVLESYQLALYEKRAVTFLETNLKELVNKDMEGKQNWIETFETTMVNLLTTRLPNLEYDQYLIRCTFFFKRPSWNDINTSG